MVRRSKLKKKIEKQSYEKLIFTWELDVLISLIALQQHRQRLQRLLNQSSILRTQRAAKKKAENPLVSSDNMRVEAILDDVSKNDEDLSNSLALAILFSEKEGLF